MKKLKMMPLKGMLLLTMAVALGCMAGCDRQGSIREISAQDSYSYIYPDETRAEADAVFANDGVLD